MEIDTIATKAYSDQAPGTSGLRKKTKAFLTQENYLENFIQSIFDACPSSEITGSTLVVSGDGRYYNNEAIQIICKIAAGNGVKRVWVGEKGLLSTPAVSCVIRDREGGVAYGGIILTASHNPGGIDEDFGVKFNTSNGGPAQDHLTKLIYDKTKVISSYKIVSKLPAIDITKIGVNNFALANGNSFTVEVISSTEDYIKLLKSIFDWESLGRLFSRKDFTFAFDGLNGVSGPYAKVIFHNILKCPLDNLHNCNPQPDFGHLHPDPNLTYADQLVKRMGLTREGNALESSIPVSYPDFGAACDGDADRAMILGKQFFVSPSDSVAIMCEYADKAIPYFKGGLKGVARSMPTSSALDLVAKRKNIPLFETPTGWKYFGNLMDSACIFKGQDYTPFICGEESFGAGSNHIREKDGIWAVLCWLSIMAHVNEKSEKLVSLESICLSFWKSYGRNFYTRYDYEGVSTESANELMNKMKEMNKSFDPSSVKSEGTLTLVSCKQFEYKDPVDGSVASNQGQIFTFKDGSRIIFRLSGTGSSGATIRLYLEKYESDEKNLMKTTKEIMAELVSTALSYSSLEKITGRKEPTVIT